MRTARTAPPATAPTRTRRVATPYAVSSGCFQHANWDPADDRRARARGRFDPQVPTKRRQAIRHAAHARSVDLRLGVESDPVVGDAEPEGSPCRGQLDDGAARVGVFRHVLEGLEHTEVGGGLDLLGVAADAVRPDVDGDRPDGVGRYPQEIEAAARSEEHTSE